MTNPMDDIFKRKLDDYELPAPMHIWENIEANHLPKEKTTPKKANRWPLLALLFMFLAIASQPFLIKKKNVKLKLDSFPIYINTQATNTEVQLKKGSTPDAIHQVPSPVSQLPAKMEQGNGLTGPSITSIKKAPIYIGQLSPNPPNNLAISPSTNLERPIQEANLKVGPNSAPTSKSFEWDSILAISSYDFAPGSTSIIQLEPLSLASAPIIPTKKIRLKARIELEIMAGAFPVSLAKKYTLLDSEKLDYLQRRQSSESQQIGYTGQIRSKIFLNSTWYIAPGLRFNQINETFRYEDTEEERLGEITSVFDSDGVLLRADTSFIIGHRQKVTYNRLQNLDFTLEVGFVKRLNNFRLGIQTGPALNLGFRSRGDLISPLDQLPATFTKGEVDALEIYRSNLSLSWLISTQLSYALNDQNSVFIEPYSQIYFAPHTMSDVFIQQNFSPFGIGIGLRRRLF